MIYNHKNSVFILFPWLFFHTDMPESFANISSLISQACFYHHYPDLLHMRKSKLPGRPRIKGEANLLTP